jgi:leucyl aminopeptidase
MRFKTMKFNTTQRAFAQVETAALLIASFEGESEAGLSHLVNTTGGGSLAAQATLEKFSGKVAQTLLHYPSGVAAKRVIVFGLGKRDNLTTAQLRKALVAAFKVVRAQKINEVTLAHVSLAGTKVSAFQYAEIAATVSGLVDYEINHNKTEGVLGYTPRPELEEMRFLSNGKVPSTVRKAFSRGRIIAQAVNSARDLSNLPAGELTPEAFVAEAKRVADESGGLITMKVWNQQDMAILGAGGILAVGKGSDEPCFLIEMVYTPPTGPTKDVLTYVGKAVCFDSGGYDLKPADGMRHMKRDMSGGGAVLTTLEAIANLQLPISVKAYMAPVENMVSGRAFKPGDRIRMMNGLKVEVDNTDAEGRLTLADMITHARNRADAGQKVYIVDVATLTGAIRQVNSDVAAGLFSNNDAFARRLKAAGERVGEQYEHLTMWPELRDFNKAEMADLKNTGGPAGAGATTAAWFVREFAGEETPWIHLDIASVAFRDREFGVDPKGSTGFAVQTLVELASDFARGNARK